MRQNGTHTTGAIGSRCMNMELLKEMNRDLADAWQSLVDALEQAADDLTRSLEGQIAAIRQSLRGEY